MLLNQVQLDYLIDLDGNALCWEDDLACVFIGDTWYTALSSCTSSEEPDWWFDVANASDSWTVEGFETLFDIEDVAPPNIESHANGSFAFDNSDNYRLDGSRLGVFSGWFDTDHTSPTVPGRESFEWVIGQMGVLEDLGD